jgi:crotonobetainyl-CoA:carnitine CoA-transferase CaiB-like acyl-CoA transferase
VISVSNDDEFGRLADAVGHPEWRDDARFATVLARHEHHDALDEAITAWTSTRDHYDVMHTLQKARVKAAAVLDGKEILFDPHFKARGQFDVLDQPALGKRPIPRHVAAKFTRFEAKARTHAPTLGEHNEEVLKELGYTDEQIAAMAEAGAIGTLPALPVPANLVSMALKLPYDRYLEHGILQAVDADYREQLGIAD